MDGNDTLDALMHQLQSAAGVQALANAAAGRGGDALAADGQAVPPDDDDDDDDDILAELKRAEAQEQAQQQAGGPSAPTLSTGDRLLHKVTREHDLYLSREARAAKEAQEALYQSGGMSADDATEWEYSRKLFASQEAAVQAEFAAAADESSIVALRPASAAALEALAVVNQAPTRRDPNSWSTLLVEVRELPLSRTRPLWQRCLALFPMQVEVVSEYVTLETEAEREHATPEDALITRLRILEVFKRHLRLCVTSAKLHVIHLTYARDVAMADPVTLKELVDAGLERVGRCLDASPLWNFAVDMMQTKMRRSPNFLENIRAYYHQWLSTPMDGLKDAGLQYGEFEKTVRAFQRIRFEAKLDERVRRAQALYVDKAKLWAELDPWFLPGSSIGADDGTMRPAAVRQWHAWSRILAEEENVSRQGLAPSAHHHRMAFILRQRLCFFPELQVCWLDLASHAVSYRLTGLADAVFREASKHFPLSLPLHLQYADFVTEGLRSPARGNEVYADLLRRFVPEVNNVLSSARSNSDGKPTGEQLKQLDSLKRDMASACCAWLSWGNHALREHGSTHVRAIAKHALQKLGMAKNAQFLQHWVRLELQHAPVTTGNAADAATLLAQAIASPVSGIMSGWLGTAVQSAQKLQAAMNTRLGSALPQALASARTIAANPRVTHGSVAYISGVADGVIEAGLQAAGMVQAAACLTPEAQATDETIATAFRAVVMDVSTGVISQGDAERCVSLLHAAGISSELLGCLSAVTARLPQLSASLRQQLENIVPLSRLVGEWITSTAVEALADLELPEEAVVKVVRSRTASLCGLVGFADDDGNENLPPDTLALRLVLGGLLADDALLLRAKNSIATARYVPSGEAPAVVGLKALLPQGVNPSPTGGWLSDLASVLAWPALPVEAVMKHVGLCSGEWNALSGFGSASEADLMTHLLSGERGNAATGATTGSAVVVEDQGSDAAVAMLPAHRPVSQGAAPGAAPDLHRWGRMTELPLNPNSHEAAATTKVGGRQRKGGFRGGLGPAQQEQAAASNVRLPSADDVLSAVVERQEFNVNAGKEENDGERRDRDDKVIHEVFTTLWRASSGAGSRFHAASLPPQQLQQEQLSSALTKLILALPTPRGVVGKVDPFIPENVAELFTEAEREAEKSGQPRPLCACTDYVMRQLAAATTLSLREL